MVTTGNMIDNNNNNNLYFLYMSINYLRLYDNHMDTMLTSDWNSYPMQTLESLYLSPHALPYL